MGELPPMGWNDEARGAKPSWEHAGKRLRTMLRLLTAKQRIALVALTGGRIVMGMCDLLLAYAMYLLFFLLQNGHAVVQRRWLPETLLATAVATLGMVVIRLLVDLLSTRSLIRYTQGLYADFIRRLVAGYHAMRWNEFTRRNRSELLKHATATALDASYAYQLLIDLVSSVMVMLGLAASLVFQNPWVACGLVAMTGFFYGLHRCVIRARLREAAADRETAARGLQAVLVEIFASAKEIRTYRNQVYFHGRVTRQVERLGASNVRLGLLPQFSRLVAEQGVVALFLLVIVGVELRHATVNNLLSILVFYFILSRRLLPLISQIGLTLGMVEGAYENIQIVERELRDCANHVEEPLTVMQPSTGWAMELECVSFAFEADTPLLREISLGVRVGEMVTLCGASGGGKSSLLDLIAGISQPDAGTVRVDPGSVAYVPQEITLLDDSVRSNLLFGLADRQDAELMEVLAKAKLKDFIVGLPLGLETRVGDNGILFSGGQRQRLGLARALLRGAKLLLLDEATSALDEENEREILGNIVAKGGPRGLAGNTPRTRAAQG